MREERNKKKEREDKNRKEGREIRKTRDVPLRIVVPVSHKTIVVSLSFSPDKPHCGIKFVGNFKPFRSSDTNNLSILVRGFLVLDNPRH